MRILVVDDDADQLEIVQHILVEQGHRVTVANGVAPAIDFLDQRSYDLLISDLVMPEASGMDLARSVREKDLDIGLILMSGYPSIATALDPAKLGPHAYLEKPFFPPKSSQRPLIRVRQPRPHDVSPPPAPIKPAMATASNGGCGETRPKCSAYST